MVKNESKAFMRSSSPALFKGFGGIRITSSKKEVSPWATDFEVFMETTFAIVEVMNITTAKVTVAGITIRLTRRRVMGAMEDSLGRSHPPDSRSESWGNSSSTFSSLSSQSMLRGLDDQYDHDHDQTGSVAWTQKKEPKCSARPSGTVALDCELPMVSENPCTGLGRAYSAVWENNMAKNQMKVSPKVRPCWFCRVL